MSTTQACGEPKYGIMAQTIGQVLPGGHIAASTWASIYPESDNQIILKRIEAIEARLAIIEPNQVLQDKYPALQEAYEAYKIIERLVNDKKA